MTGRREVAAGSPRRRASRRGVGGSRMPAGIAGPMGCAERRDDRVAEPRGEAGGGRRPHRGRRGEASHRGCGRTRSCPRRGGRRRRSRPPAGRAGPCRSALIRVGGGGDLLADRREGRRDEARGHVGARPCLLLARAVLDPDEAARRRRTDEPGRGRHEVGPRFDERRLHQRGSRGTRRTKRDFQVRGDRRNYVGSRSRRGERHRLSEMRPPGGTDRPELGHDRSGNSLPRVPLRFRRGVGPRRPWVRSGSAFPIASGTMSWGGERRAGRSRAPPRLLSSHRPGWGRAGVPVARSCRRPDR